MRRILESARRLRWPLSGQPLSGTVPHSLRPKRLEGLHAANHVAYGNLTLGPSDLLQSVWIGQNRQRFLKRFEIFRTHKYCRGHAVAGYHDAFMLAMNPFDEIREAIPHCPQRLS